METYKKILLILLILITFESFCRRQTPDSILRPSNLLIEVRNKGVILMTYLGNFIGNLFNPKFFIDFIFNFKEKIIQFINYIKILFYDIFLIEDFTNIFKAIVNLSDIPYTFIMTFVNKISNYFN